MRVTVIRGNQRSVTMENVEKVQVTIVRTAKHLEVVLQTAEGSQTLHGASAIVFND